MIVSIQAYNSSMLARKEDYFSKYYALNWGKDILAVGFIGPNYVFYHLAAHPEDKIIVVDKLTYAGNLSTLAPVMDQIRFYKTDICDRDAIYVIFETKHPDVVINFAAESHVDRSIEYPSIFLETNIIGTSVLMDACRKYGNVRYHQVSTDEVYGDLPLDRPDLFFTEETPIHTSSPYSSSKAGRIFWCRLTRGPTVCR